MKRGMFIGASLGSLFAPSVSVWLNGTEYLEASIWGSSVMLLYTLSAWQCWGWFRRAYSSTGKWAGCAPDSDDILFVLIPLLNTFIVVVNLLDSPYRDNSKDKSKFFDL